MKNYIINILTEIKNENITDEQCVWKFLWHKIQTFFISFSKGIAGPTKTQSIILKTKLKTLEHQIYVATLSICVNS